MSLGEPLRYGPGRIGGDQHMPSNSTTRIIISGAASLAAATASIAQPISGNLNGKVDPLNLPSVVYDIIDLGNFAVPGRNAAANAIELNEAGHVAGVAEDNLWRGYAFIYKDGELINLGRRSGKGINNNDEVVGWFG